MPGEGLRIDHVTKQFGGLVAVDDVSLTVGAHEIAGLVGPNGAGKTTLFNLISGHFAPDAGALALDGNDIAGLPPHRVAGRGVQRTFQNIRLFNALPVRDNVAVAIVHAGGGRLRAARLAALELLHEVGFTGRVDALPRELPYATQRRVEIARALGARPRVLLLDEPAAGMDAHERVELRDLVRRVHARGLIVLLIEHDMGLVSDLCERVIVLDFGRVIADGAPDTVRSDPAVVDAYLGVDA